MAFPRRIGLLLACLSFSATPAWQGAFAGEEREATVPAGSEAENSLLYRGRLLEKQGDQGRLLDFLTQWTSRYPGHFLGWSYHCRVLVQAKNFAEAEKMCAKAVRLGEQGQATPGQMKLALMNYGKASVARREFATARETCAKVEELDSKSAEAQKCIGDSLRLPLMEYYRVNRDAAMLGDPSLRPERLALPFEESTEEALLIAEAAYRKAIELSRADAELMYNLGSIYMLRNEYTKASTSLKKAADIDPDYMDVWSALGTSMFLSGEREEAMKLAESIRETRPEQAKALHQFFTINRIMQERYETK